MRQARIEARSRVDDLTPSRRLVNTSICLELGDEERPNVRPSDLSPPWHNTSCKAGKGLEHSPIKQ